MKETVCLTGASGGIGQALLAELLQTYTVKALFRTRSPVSDAWVGRGCVAVWGDLENDRALSELVTGARLVFHCAAVIGGSYEESSAVNVDGTRRLARAAAARGCQRFVHVSSVAVYSGATNATEYSEETPVRERPEMAAYALTKLRSERALIEVARESGLEYTILRPTCVYGPRTKPYTSLPLALMRKGLPVIVGAGSGLVDVVYVGDVARALVLAARSPQAQGEVFNLGHEAVTLNEFYAEYGRMLGRPVRHVPISLVRGVERLLRLVPVRRTRVQELRKGLAFLIDNSESSKRFPSSKASARFGYAPGVDLSTGMLRTKVWAKQEGLVP